MNVEAFGSTTTLPWRMCGTSIAEYLLQSGYVDQAGYEAVLSGALGVHPTFFYESMWNLAGLFLVYQLGKRWRKYDGECFLFYLCWYGLGRAWIEGPADRQPVFLWAGVIWNAHPGVSDGGGGVLPGRGCAPAVPALPVPTTRHSCM